MKNIYKTIFKSFLLAGAMGLAMTSCIQEEEQTVAKAVLGDENVLTFAAESPQGQVITVVSDAEWTATVPSWITIDPTRGTGKTEVTVVAASNVDAEGPLKPRRDTLVFAGATKASRFVVIVKQEGNKFRGVGNSTVAEVVGAADDTVVIVPEATVAAVTADGHIITDGQNYIHVIEKAEAAVGATVSVKGEKTSEAGYAAIVADELEVTGSGEYAFPADAEDITAKIDEFTAEARTPVVVVGMLENASKIVTGAYNEKGDFIVSEAAHTIKVLNADPALGLADLMGHVVKVQGYFAGVSSDAVSMHLATAEDKGLLYKLETVLYYDDFNVQKNNTPDLKDGYTWDMQGAGVSGATYTAGALVDFRTSYKQKNGGGSYNDYENPLWPGHSGVQARTGTASAHLYPCVTNAATQATESWFQINDINLCGSKNIQMGMAIFNSSDGGSIKDKYHFFYMFDTDGNWQPYADFAGSDYNWEWITLKALKVPEGAKTVSFRGETSIANHMRLDDITLVGDGEAGEAPAPAPYLSLISDANVTVPAEGAEIEVKYASNVACENNLAEFASWITPKGQTAGEDGSVTVTLTVAANTGDAREAVITLSNKEKNLSASVTVKQKGQESLKVNLPFSDDFSWMDPYIANYNAKAGKTIGKSVEENNASGNAPNAYTEANLAGIIDELIKQGYEDINAAKTTLYPQDNYWKMGATNKHTGLKLPAFNYSGDVELSFDWSPHMTGKGAIDKVNIVVEVEGDGEVVTAAGSAKISDPTVNDWETGKLGWKRVSFVVKGITPKTRIIVRPQYLEDHDGITQMRWYIDNIKVEQYADESSPILAQWAFSADKMAADGYAETFKSADKAAGNGGQFVKANAAGNGKLEYYQIDKTELDADAKAARIIGGTGQPYVTGAWVGDYWLFTATASKERPAGTKVQFKAISKCSNTGMKYWLLEYKDGSEWKPVSATTTEEINGKSATYNIKHNNADELPIDVTVTMAKAFKSVEFRMTCVANAQAKGGAALAKPNGGTHRFGGDETTAPVIQVVE